MVEVRTRDLDRQHLGTVQLIGRHIRLRCLRMLAGRLGRPCDAANDPLRIGSVGTAQLFDGALHPADRMLGQQLQHPHVLPHPGTCSMPALQTFAKFVERSGKLPPAVDVGVVQSGRPASQRRQVMPRIENLVTVVVAPRMRGHHRLAQHDLDAVDVAFDRHRLKRTVTRHAVIHVVEAGELILVDLDGLTDAGIEPVLRQRGRPTGFLGEALADGL